MPEDNIYFNAMPKDTTSGVEVSVTMAKEDQEKGNGPRSSPAQKWLHVIGCNFTMDEVGLLNLKLTILVVFCVILGTFLVAFEVQHFVTMETCADSTQKMEMLHQQYENATAMTRTLEASLTETNMKLKEQRDVNMNITEENTQLKAEIGPLQLQIEMCRDGWKYFGGNLYFFSSDKKTWAESRDACIAKGGDLVIIESAEEMEFLSDNGREHYIGLTDGRVEGTWQWVDNTTLKDPKFWGRGQPDNLVLPGWDSSREDCAIISQRQWFDIPCDRLYKSICESKLSV